MSILKGVDMQHMKVSADLFRAMCGEAGVPITRSEQKLLKAMTERADSILGDSQP